MPLYRTKSEAAQGCLRAQEDRDVTYSTNRSCAGLLDARHIGVSSFLRKTRVNVGHTILKEWRDRTFATCKDAFLVGDTAG
jgi:hypothetical protein